MVGYVVCVLKPDTSGYDVVASSSSLSVAVAKGKRIAKRLQTLAYVEDVSTCIRYYCDGVEPVMPGLPGPITG